jgi:hypothetical protein
LWGYGSFSRRKIAENEIGKVTGTVASVAPEVVLPLLLRGEIAPKSTYLLVLT